MPTSAEKPPDFRFVPLADLEFDPLNPRLPASAAHASSDKIFEFMLEDAGLLELMASIAQQGFFPGEPLLACPSELTDGKFTIVEGNRRLAASKLLSQPSLAPARTSVVSRLATENTAELDRIPCLVFETRGQILRHLGYRHVTGIKEWDPLAKARYLSQRFDETSGGSESARIRSVARSIGSRSDYVARLLTALALFNRIESSDFYGIDGLDETTVSFSLISSVLGYVDIVEYLNLASSADYEARQVNAESLENLTTWMFNKVPENGGTILGESRNIRRLADAVADPRSRKRLERGDSLDRALASIPAEGGAAKHLLSARTSLEYARDQVSGRLDETEREYLENISSLISSIRKRARK